MNRNLHSDRELVSQFPSQWLLSLSTCFLPFSITTVKEKVGVLFSLKYLYCFSRLKSYDKLLKEVPRRNIQWIYSFICKHLLNTKHILGSMKYTEETILIKDRHSASSPKVWRVVERKINESIMINYI